MSKPLSLKLRDDIFEETETLLRHSGKARNAYFNEAIHFYNMLWRRKLLKKRLRAESALVASDSAEVLAVLERLDDELPS